MKWLERDTIRTPHMTLCLSAADFQSAVEHCKVVDLGRWLDVNRQMACLHTWEQQDGMLTCVICLHPDALRNDCTQALPQRLA
ncbi:hypothetical protein [Janthinobacterium sp. P210006]|uniref:hypothetical protein n=1 Tax=Janthinobacterium sp. P210006 TaxID=3112939 RepID=UPI002E260682|nr:hypothetical protein [Janthinobacterium sp. P210006]